VKKNTRRGLTGNTMDGKTKAQKGKIQTQEKPQAGLRRLGRRHETPGMCAQKENKIVFEVNGDKKFEERF